MMTPDRQGALFHYWISFWPVAPFFGVSWRFEKLMPTAPFFSPTRVAADMAKAGAAEAARAASEAAETLSHQVDAATHAAADAVSTAAGAVSRAAGEAFAARVEEATHAAADAMASAADLLGAAARGAAVTLAPAPAEPVSAEPAPAADAGPASVESDLAARKPALLYDRRPAGADDLKRIRGVGPKLEAMLNDMGVYTLEQIAGFDEANLAWIDSNLTAFRGRSLRDDWIAQAKALL